MRLKMYVVLTKTNIINDNIKNKLFLLSIYMISRSIFVATGLHLVLILSIFSLCLVSGLSELFCYHKMIFKYPRPPPE